MVSSGKHVLIVVRCYHNEQMSGLSLKATHSWDQPDCKNGRDCDPELDMKKEMKEMSPSSHV